MLDVMRLTSPANSRIKRALKLRKHRDRRKTGLLLAEGLREVPRAVQAGLTIHEVFYSPGLLGEDGMTVCDALRPALEAQMTLNPKRERIGWYELPADLLTKMCYREDPEGILAVASQPASSLDDLGACLIGAGQGEPLLLAAVGTEKPGNLGAMVRTAEAAGCGGVIAAGAPVDVWNPNAIRASTCAVFSLPTVSVSEEEAIAWLSERGVRIMAATLDEAIAYDQANWRGPTCLAIGPEDVGLSDAWLEAADRTGGQRVQIPMRGRLVDSLNASNAAAVLMFEAVRARA